MPARNYYQSSMRRKTGIKKVTSQKTGESTKLEITVPAKLIDGTEESVKPTKPTINPFPRQLTLGGVPLGVRGPLFEREWSVSRQPKSYKKDQ